MTCFQSFGQQAKKISLQGFLKDANGKAVPDAKNFAVTFKLYTTLSGGTAAWTEDQNVDVSGGVYSVQLGKNIPLGNLSWGNSTYYVGVTIGGVELTPRTELTFAPYSLGSPTADKATTVVCSGALGDVKYSILNPTQFALQNGNCWVPMDGGSMTGSKLAAIIGGSNVPNAGGLFLRGQESANGSTDNDPERNSNSAIAQLQGQNYESHGHSASLSVTGSTSNGGSHSHFGSIPARSEEGGFIATNFASFSATDRPAVFNQTFNVNTAGDHAHSISGSASGSTNNAGGNETRPKNLNLWTYIRIN